MTFDKGGGNFDRPNRLLEGKLYSDYSNFVIHFTKKNPPSCQANYATQISTNVSKLSAFERLNEILKTKVIHSMRMPHVGSASVCLTECTWDGLIQHADRYSPYGVGFKKSFVFNKGGGPTFYVRQDLWEAQVKSAKKGFVSIFSSFITPFNPRYASAEHLKNTPKNQKVDFAYEREWRVSKSLTFDLHEIALLIVKNISEAHTIATSFHIPEDKILIMSNYQKIRGLWKV